MARDRIGVENGSGDAGLRRRHQRRIGGDPVRGGVGIRPVVGQRTAARAQQCHRVGEVGVEEAVVGDHLGDAGVAEQRRAVCSEREAVADALGQPQGRRRLEQTFGPVRRQPGVDRDLGDRPRSDAEKRQQAGLDDCGGDLRIDEPGDDIEQPGRAPPRHRPRQWEVPRPALKRRVGKTCVAPFDPAVAPRYHGGGVRGGGGTVKPLLSNTKFTRSSRPRRVFHIAPRRRSRKEVARYPAPANNEKPLPPPAGDSMARDRSRGRRRTARSRRAPRQSARRRWLHVPLPSPPASPYDAA